MELDTQRTHWRPDTLKANQAREANEGAFQEISARHLPAKCQLRSHQIVQARGAWRKKIITHHEPIGKADTRKRKENLLAYQVSEEQRLDLAIACEQK